MEDLILWNLLFFCRDDLNLKATLPIEQKIFVWMLEWGIVNEKRKTLDIIINILFFTQTFSISYVLHTV